MPNDLTGDYDVVAAFSLQAVDRILAAMHRGKHLPHSLSMAVDDIPQLRLGVAAVGVIDRYGEAVADRVTIKQVAYARPLSKVVDSDVINRLDPVVNWRAYSKLGQLPDVSLAVSSYLSGVAQLQLGPPTMQLPRGSSHVAEVHTPVWIRYFTDPHTRELSEFMRGDIVTSFGVRNATSPTGTTVIVDTAGPQGNVHFVMAWSAVPLGPADMDAINKALHQALKQSFQPSTTKRPNGIRQLDFKGFPAQGAVGLLMNVSSDEPAGPASVGGVALAPNDHFTLAVNGDRITGPLVDAAQAALPARVNLPDINFKFTIGAGPFTVDVVNCTVHSRVSLGASSVALIPDFQFFSVRVPGRLLLTIPAHVDIWWTNKPSVVSIPSGFDMTLTQAFGLTVAGRNVQLQRLGDVDVHYSGDTLVRPLVGSDTDLQTFATPAAKQIFNNNWDSQQSAVESQLNQALSANQLQGFLTTLMNPAAPSSRIKDRLALPGTEDPDTLTETVIPDLEYTSVEMTASGIVLHGSLSVPPWPPPHVRFEKDPWSSTGEPEYEALKTWVPGGAVREYQWHFHPTTLMETNRFATVKAPPLPGNQLSVCLTVTGRRITASGPIAYEDVFSARVCRLMGIPLGALTGVDGSKANTPHVVVPGPQDPGGPVEGIAHTSPWAQATSGAVATNLLAYFPDDRSAQELSFLTEALAASRRDDTHAAIVCVMTREQMAIARVIPGITYADDAAVWERALNARERPALVLLNPKGDVAWRHAGTIGGGALAQALREHLAQGGQYAPRFVDVPLRVGELSPNFLFEGAPQQPLTLRKLKGRRMVLIFSRTASDLSLQAAAGIHRLFPRQEVEPLLVLSILDGESGDLAAGVAAGQDGATIVVPDPEREISSAYGITVWPTFVFLAVDGTIENIHFGALPEQIRASLESTPAHQPGKAGEAC